MIKSISAFIKMLKNDREYAHALIENGSIEYLLQEMTLEQFYKIAQHDSRMTRKIMLYPALKQNIVEQLTFKDILELSRKDKELMRLVLASNFYALRYIDDLNIAAIKQLFIDYNAVVKELVATGYKWEKNKSGKENYCTLQKKIAQEATVDELITLLETAKDLIWVIMQDENIRQMLAKKAQTDQIIKLLEIAENKAKTLLPIPVIEEILCDGMTLERFFKLINIEASIAVQLLKNKPVNDLIMQDERTKTFLEKTLRGYGWENVAELLLHNVGDAILLCHYPDFRIMFAERATPNDFFEVMERQPLFAQLLFGEPELQEKMVNTVSLQQLITPVQHKQQWFTCTLAKSKKFQERVLTAEKWYSLLIELNTRDKEAVTSLVSNPDILTALSNEIIKKNDITSFVILAAHNGQLAGLILPSVFPLLAAEIQTNNLLELVKISTTMGNQLCGVPRIFTILINYMTLSGFMETVIMEEAITLFYMQNNVLRRKLFENFSGHFTLTHLIDIFKYSYQTAEYFISREIEYVSDEKNEFAEQFIKLVCFTLPETFALDLLKMNKSVRACLASTITPKQFIKLATLDVQITRELACRRDFKKVILQNITIEELVELIEIDNLTVLQLVLDAETLRLFYDPANMVILMQHAENIAFKLIENEPSILEILYVNNMPERYPELFGFLTWPDKASFAESCGLKPIEEYHPILLFLLGKAIAKRLCLTNLPEASISLASVGYLGAYFLKSLHRQTIDPDDGLCEEFVFIENLARLRDSFLHDTCKSKQHFFFESSDNEEKYINKKIIRDYLINYFSSFRLSSSIFESKQNAENKFFSDIIYDALIVLDEERYRERKDMSIESAFSDLNEQNQRLFNILLEKQEQESVFSSPSLARF